MQLVYSESYGSLEKAIGRERQLKRWSRTKKKALIVGDAARPQQGKVKIQDPTPNASRKDFLAIRELPETFEEAGDRDQATVDRVGGEAESFQRVRA